MADDYVSRIKRLLSRHSISTYRFEQRRRHRVVVVMHLGKECTIIFSASGSGWRGPRNAVSTLRRRLGLTGNAAP